MSRFLERRLAAIIGEWEGLGLRYTRRQLSYALCRSCYPLPRWATLRLPFTLPAPLAPERAEAAIDDYVEQGQVPAGLLGEGGAGAVSSAPDALTPRPPLPHAGEGGLLPQRTDRLPPPSSFNLHPASFQSHTLPRLLLCEDAELAAMLRANNLHQELACPILAVAEAMPLPAWLAAMLADGAQVALLHDASPAGMALADALPGRLGLPANARYRPIGLRPAHALRLHLVARRVGGQGDGRSLPTASLSAVGSQPASGKLRSYTAACFLKHDSSLALRRFAGWASFPEAARTGNDNGSTNSDRLSAPLAPAERRWLAAGWAAEAQAIPPLRLLRALRRIMSDTPAAPSLLARLRGARELGFMTWPEAQ